MHPVRKQRLMVVLFIVVATSVAAALVFFALRENMNLFYPPADIAAGKAPVGTNIRAGGMVKKGSVEKAGDSLKVDFVVTDYSADLRVTYTGILPDLFEEEQGVVVAGQLDATGLFVAHEVLAKHDENYMPPEVADALKKSEYSQ
ncbi:MAG TPA: cytochrome c maturation protein CcmE [Pseudomonadales bacterium]|nr:cytochrome c maturation protein CcmE [Pseudomonadales bacterium]